MSASVTTVYVQNNGDQKTWKVEVTNSGNADCYNAKVTFTIPPGISMVGPLIDGTSEIEVTKGAYNPSEDKWYIGKILKDEVVSSSFEFQVDDISQADPIEDYFDIEALFESDCPDPEDCDNEAHLLMRVGEECIGIDLSAGPSDEDANYEGGLNITID